ncbi:hypothetical protein IWW38_005428, partial [Coemansia aciculifera]
EVAEYYALLKQSWPKEHAAAAGLRGIERMVRALLAQDKTELRSVLGLNVGGTPLDPDESPHFYDHCARIQALASSPPMQHNGGSVEEGRRVGRPDRRVFNKTLHAYALNGDICAVLDLLEAHGELRDAASWTELVRCVLVQVRDGDDTGGRDFDWLGFILDLNTRLLASAAQRFARFTHVTFGQVIQAAVERDDFKAVPRIVEYMLAHTSVRFNKDMLRMVLALDYPFAIKCGMVKSALAACTKALVPPDGRLLGLVVKMAKCEADLKVLPEIVGVYRNDFGITLGDGEYRYLIDSCVSLNLTDLAKYWI